MAHAAFGFVRRWRLDVDGSSGHGNGDGSQGDGGRAGRSHRMHRMSTHNGGGADMSLAFGAVVGACFSLDGIWMLVARTHGVTVVRWPGFRRGGAAGVPSYDNDGPAGEDNPDSTAGGSTLDAMREPVGHVAVHEALAPLRDADASESVNMACAAALGPSTFVVATTAGAVVAYTVKTGRQRARGDSRWDHNLGGRGLWGGGSSSDRRSGVGHGVTIEARAIDCPKLRGQPIMQLIAMDVTSGGGGGKGCAALVVTPSLLCILRDGGRASNVVRVDSLVRRNDLPTAFDGSAIAPSSRIPTESGRQAANVADIGESNGTVGERETGRREKDAKEDMGTEDRLQGRVAPSTNGNAAVASLSNHGLDSQKLVVAAQIRSRRGGSNLHTGSGGARSMRALAAPGVMGGTTAAATSVDFQTNRTSLSLPEVASATLRSAEAHGNGDRVATLKKRAAGEVERGSRYAAAVFKSVTDADGWKHEASVLLLVEHSVFSIEYGDLLAYSTSGTRIVEERLAVPKAHGQPAMVRAAGALVAVATRNGVWIYASAGNGVATRTLVDTLPSPLDPDLGVAGVGMAGRGGGDGVGGASGGFTTATPHGRGRRTSVGGTVQDVSWDSAGRHVAVAWRNRGVTVFHACGGVRVRVDDATENPDGDSEPIGDDLSELLPFQTAIFAPDDTSLLLFPQRAPLQRHADAACADALDDHAATYAEVPLLREVGNVPGGGGLPLWGGEGCVVLVVPPASPALARPCREVVSLPKEYARGNGPVLRAASTADLDEVAVACAVGFAVFHRSRAGWSLFDDVRQEEQLTVTAMAFVTKRILLVAADLVHHHQDGDGAQNNLDGDGSGGTTAAGLWHELILYPPGNLDSSAIIGRYQMPARVEHVSLQGRWLCVAMADGRFVLFEVVLVGSSRRRVALEECHVFSLGGPNAKENTLGLRRLSGTKQLLLVPQVGGGAATIPWVAIVGADMTCVVRSLETGEEVVVAEGCFKAWVSAHGMLPVNEQPTAAGVVVEGHLVVHQNARERAIVGEDYNHLQGASSSGGVFLYRVSGPSLSIGLAGGGGKRLRLSVEGRAGVGRAVVGVDATRGATSLLLAAPVVTRTAGGTCFDVRLEATMHGHRLVSHAACEHGAPAAAQIVEGFHPMERKMVLEVALYSHIEQLISAGVKTLTSAQAVAGGGAEAATSTAARQRYLRVCAYLKKHALCCDVVASCARKLDEKYWKLFFPVPFGGVVDFFYHSLGQKHMTACENLLVILRSTESVAVTRRAANDLVAALEMAGRVEASAAVREFSIALEPVI